MPGATVHARLLDALFAVSVLALVFLGVELLGQPPGVFGVERGSIGLVAAALLVLLWWRRPRQGGSVGFTLAFTLVALVASVAGDGVLALLPVFCALVLLVLDFGERVGAALVAGLVVTQFVAMATIVGAPVRECLVQSVGTGAVLTFVLAFAVLLRRSAVESAERALLLDERDAANAALAHANTRLRESIDMEKEFVLAQERARSARELHDGLGHRLTVATMSLDFALRSRNTAPGRAWDEVATARQTVQEAMSEMRLWVRALHPVSVGGLSGPEALDAVAEAFRGTGVDVRFEVTGSETPLPDAVQLFCHRFVQEGLTNALRHARAQVVTVGLDYRPEGLTLTLSDDGSAGAVTEPVQPGFGLRSLSERAEQLGGSVEAAAGKPGLVLTARLPSVGVPVAEVGAP